MQVSSLTKENKNLVEKLGNTKNDDSLIGSHNANLGKREFFPKSDSAQCLKSFEESVTEASSTSFQVSLLVDNLFASLFSNRHGAPWEGAGFLFPWFDPLLNGLASMILRYGYRYEHGYWDWGCVFTNGNP